MDELETLMAEAGLADSIKDRIRGIANGARATDIDLNVAALGDTGAKALALALTLVKKKARLTKLWLQGNPIQTEGAISLAEALSSHQHLELLDLKDCAVGPRGVVALVGMLRHQEELEWLNLSGNAIEVEGADALVDALQDHPALQRIQLKGIGVDAARAFGARWPLDPGVEIGLNDDEEAAFEEGREMQQRCHKGAAEKDKEKEIDEMRHELARLQQVLGEKNELLRLAESKEQRHADEVFEPANPQKAQLEAANEEIKQLRMEKHELTVQRQKMRQTMKKTDETMYQLRDQLRDFQGVIELEDKIETLLNLNMDPTRFTEKQRVKDRDGKFVKGAFGRLFRSTLAGHDVALKEVDDVEERPRLRQLLAEMSNTATLAQGVGKRILREVAILVSLRHPNIVQFLGICHDSASNKLAFVLSWAENGSLYDYMHVHNNDLSDVQRLRMLSEVAGAMEFLHAHNVVHRDLKSPNVLLDSSLSAKVTDFGLSTFRQPGQSQVSQVIGTLLWASPEQLLQQELRADTDVFSFGCLMWEVWLGIRPWHHGQYGENGITFAHLVAKYQEEDYLPLDVEIQGRRLTPALQALTCVCLQWSGNRGDFSQLHAALKVQQSATREQEVVTLERHQQHMLKQHLLLHGPPDAAWKFSQQLLAAVDATQLSIRQSVHIAPLQRDGDAVTELLRAAGGRTAQEHPRTPFGHRLSRVAITWCDQKLVAFNGALHRNTTRYRGHLTSASHPFAPKYDHDTLTGQATDAEERALLERVTCVGVYSMLDPTLLQQDPPIRIQRVFHGVRSFDAVVGILGGDFAQLQRTDGGWFGAGLYFTPDLDYAFAYTHPRQVKPSRRNVPADLRCLNLTPGKLYRLVLACDVMYGNPYPVLDLHLKGRPLMAGHDAHVSVVDFTKGNIVAAQPFQTHAQWSQGDKKPAAEIMITDPSCVLVRAILVFDA
ncbi:TKL protein kinase [Salpingoeca rosetta]|uniref:TKL protein kinase n=1 Tax=Salpingoeca rosetta (strain ATCC 50818 / BSB-021) TaxID=946362 RepID=F2U1J9_SALR5|nr:TKL protein kinase [Salpingoeca rosetta]EGD81501.1 TKL protein kinase [Salpingoeca rosetta]|eukprot:XP_004996705.1 TKL protein kinase [Salpingoeca rosetta]